MQTRLAMGELSGALRKREEVCPNSRVTFIPLSCYQGRQVPVDGPPGGAANHAGDYSGGEHRLCTKPHECGTGSMSPTNAAMGCWEPEGSGQGECSKVGFTGPDRGLLRAGLARPTLGTCARVTAK